MLVSAAVLSSPGKVRANNQDKSFLDTEKGLFVVSDGMGGAQAGEVAAQLVATILPRMIHVRLAGDPSPHSQTVRSWLRQDMLSLSKEMNLKTAGNPLADGMGATVVLALVLGERAFIAHMGDSRAYLHRGEKLSQLTEDHSVVSLLLRAGEITDEQARVHAARGQLTRFMGMKEEVYGDVKTVRLKSGDRLLLCTDGLTEMVSDDQIADLLTRYPAPNDACDRLVRAANEAGGKDNVTALVVNISSSGKAIMQNRP